MKGVEVLYIAGMGRSGSTILDLVLGQVDGLVSVGEVKFIWERGIIQNRSCGCGQLFSSCPFWTEVMRLAFGEVPDGDRAVEMSRASDGFRTRQLPLLVSELIANRYIDRYGAYMEGTGRLYRAILDVSDSSVIVDSSKFPSYLAMLGSISTLRVRTVHIVRDPRAVAHSWTRDKADPDHPTGAPMPKQHPATTGMYWTTWNAAIERIGRRQDGYLRVRYEDLTAAPGETLREILDFASLGHAELPLVDGSRVMMRASHTVSGNPIRHETGSISIRQDAAWIKEMSPRMQRWASVASSPNRRRYGY